MSQLLKTEGSPEGTNQLRQRRASWPRIGVLLWAFSAIALPATESRAEPPPAELAAPLIQPASAHELSSAPWQPYKLKRGIPVARRAVPNSRYFEYQVVLTSTLSPQTLLDIVWRQLAKVTSGAVKSRQILSQSANEILVYDQIHSSIVTDRDYTLRMQRILDATGRTVELFFESANQSGPPPNPKFVRVPVIRGSWTAEADGSSGSRLTHRNFSEPGGSIPAFLVHGPQCDQVVDSMVRLQEQLRQLPPATATAPSRHL